MKTILTFHVINSNDVKDDFQWHFEDAPPELKQGDSVVTSNPSKSVVPVFEIHGQRTIRKEGAALIIHYLVRRVEGVVKSHVDFNGPESTVGNRDPVE